MSASPRHYLTQMCSGGIWRIAQPKGDLAVVLAPEKCLITGIEVARSAADGRLSRGSGAQPPKFFLCSTTDSATGGGVQHRWREPRQGFGGKYYFFLHMKLYNIM